MSSQKTKEALARVQALYASHVQVPTEMLHKLIAQGHHQAAADTLPAVQAAAARFDMALFAEIEAAEKAQAAEEAEVNKAAEPAPAVAPEGTTA